jgi:hypothetical protein
MKICSKCYSDWRRSEAYAVPCTPEGDRLAQERLEGFAKGWYAGVKTSANRLEAIHSLNKDTHKFYLKASINLRDMLND